MSGAWGRALFRLGLLSVLGCSGCTLFLPHSPCLVYSGDIHNAHGFGELGRGGNIYRSAGVTYVFNPSLTVLQAAGSDLVIEVSDPQQAWFTDAGITLIIQCRKPGLELAVRSTADDTLRAWLVRNQEYPLRAVKPQTVDEFVHRDYVPPDYAPLLTKKNSNTKPLPAGVFRLRGDIEIRARRGPAVNGGIDFLAFHLSTAEVIPPDEAWLTRNERVTAEQSREFPTAVGPREDAGAWAALRRGGHVRPTVGQIGGSFQTEQCLDYKHMP